ncbi:MAG: helix-turn-helix domain-containing protein [Pseudonocardia sp.]|nr:helix-turn-helix domain-containing protein [Pseudonocardia sp.]
MALRRARVSRGWSLRRAAEVTEVSYPMLHHLEAGTRWPSVIVAELLIARYRLDEDTAAGLRAVARPLSGRSSPYRTGW